AAYMCVSLKSTPRPPTSALSPYTTLFRSGRNMSEYFQLRFRFDVKTKNTYVQRACHSRPCFAHTREHNSLGLAARAQHPLQLTAGNYIETGTQLGKQIKNGKIGVGFDGIANHAGMCAQSFRISQIVLGKSSTAVHIGWGAKTRSYRT